MCLGVYSSINRPRQSDPCIELRTLLPIRAMTVAWPSDIEEYILERLTRHNIKTPEDVLIFNETALAKRLGISITSCRQVIQSVSKLFAPTPRTALEIYQTVQRISSTLPSLDAMLDGGLQVGWLVEVAGEAGVGKTQWSLSVAAAALKAGKRVYWIDTEATFRPERLLDILGPGSEALLDNLSLARCSSLQELLDTIHPLKDILSSIPPSEAPLIVIDSVAAAARPQIDDLMNRQRLLHQLALLVKSTNAVTIATNHVLGNMRDGKAGSGSIPALGNTWAHDITCRVWFKCSDRDESSGQGSKTRWLELPKSPSTGGGSDRRVLFDIQKSGIRQL